MGCDIHLHVETKARADAAWQPLGEWRRRSNSDHTYEDIETNEAQWREWHATGICPPYELVKTAMQADSTEFVGSPIGFGERRYSLFGVLAGVRDKDVDRITDEPRGMPDDVSVEVLHEWARWGPDAHSVSHFTLAELTCWEGWDGNLTRSGFVTIGPYPNQVRPDDEWLEQFQKTANWDGQLPRLGPDDWNASTCSAHYGPGQENWRPYSFEEHLGNAVGAAWWRFLFDLSKLALQSGSVENVRIVFWFDN